MKIRFADRFDIPSLIRMMLDYRNYSPVERLRYCENTEHAERLFDQILAGRGIALVAEKDEKTVGMLVAVRTPNAWDPDIWGIQELAYWVDPEHRTSSAGYKLLKKYQERCEQAKELGTIDYYTISKMVNSPDLSYDRFGFKKIEETWSVT